jgi:secreted trypsin-like serine protease
MKTLLAFLLLAGSVFAGTIDPKASDQKHLDYGSQFECVAKISCRYTKSGVTGWASCVIISEHWIVTAAHVVAEAEDWVVYVSGEKYPLDRVYVHEDFETGNGNDIAVGHSERKIALSFFPALYGQEDEQGQVVSICGHGIAGTFATGHVLADGKKRAGSNMVDYVDPKGLLVCSVGSGTATQLEYLISPGDSGGGLFVGKELAGINSVVMSVGRAPLSKWGDESGHTRISKHKEWICERVAVREGPGGEGRAGKKEGLEAETPGD